MCRGDDAHAILTAPDPARTPPGACLSYTQATVRTASARADQTPGSRPQVWAMASSCAG